MEMSVSDELIHTTVRIEAYNNNVASGTGTGFFFNFCEDHDGNGKSVPAVVTNKHVIDGSDSWVFHMTLSDEEGNPEYGNHVRIPVERAFAPAWIRHPDDNVDLAALPIAFVLEGVKKQFGKPPFLKTINRSLLADDEFMKQLGAVEDILMIGYPNGLWDKENNLPIARHGVTATPPYANFEGTPEFLIDCACFPGSSGSPVFLFNLGSYAPKSGGINIGSRIKFLGVLWGGPQYQAEGEIRAVPVPSAVQQIATTRIPSNLGFCVKANQLLVVEEHFAKILNKKEQMQAVTEEMDASS